MARLSLAEAGLLLLLALMISTEVAMGRPKKLRRQKREWIIPPAKLKENVDYTHKEFIAKIRSDKDLGEKVEYHLSGEGADKPPINLFIVDPDTGFVRVTKILDREEYPMYNLTGSAKFRNGTNAEDKIPLTVRVLDENDNAPYFNLHSGSITESSKKGTFVMKIEGMDKDQAGTPNAELAYTIISQEPAINGDMFTINRETGELYVKEPTLDRETHDFYRLVIQGTDMKGGPGGLTGTGTVEIKILDINDNVPTLEKSEYDGTVDENVADVVVMRIKALDDDLEPTDNWLAVFSIVKGNEDNLFSIETDPKTNEGILKLIKAVDFEEVQNLELGLLIENVAPLVEGNAVAMDVDVQIGEGGGAGAGAGAGAGLGVGAGAGAGAGPGPGVDLGLGLDVGLDAGLDVGVGPGVDLDLGLDVGLDAGLDAGAGVKPGPGPGLGVGLKPGPGLGVGLKPGSKPRPKPKPKTPGKSYPIKIAVNNVPEGPAFVPKTKPVHVSEDPNEMPEDGVVTVFSAIDPDTGAAAEDVSYAKAYDPDNWFTVDEETAEIKLNKVPDRESKFLVNGTYIAKILCMTKDMPSMTATGTLAIQVFDSNDHCPTLTTTHDSLCSDEKTVYITGFDEDVKPNGAPFSFRIIPEGTRGNWDIEILNETTAALHSREFLWPGSYELEVEVLDEQGLSCPSNEVFSLEVCTCTEIRDCSLRTGKLVTTSSILSAPVIGMLLGAICLLLFVPLLLLFCQCGGANGIFPDQFTDLPFGAKEHLISYHTEGNGEDKKAACATPAKESLLVYDYEGQGSSAGSIGCCSLLESYSDLQFLNDLGPKFKTLAEICSPPTPPTPKPSPLPKPHKHCQPHQPTQPYDAAPWKPRLVPGIHPRKWLEHNGVKS
ncbi:desmoglein-2.1-like [Diretmus argenteus]